MALVVPCIKGKMGDTEFYEATIPARELVTGVRPASELDNWASMGIEERMQRDPNLKRITQEIAPYIAKSKDRFFGSVIVLVYRGDVYFESLKELGSKLPHAYRSVGDNIGFITIDGGSLIVLDGQHRLLALEKVIKNEVVGPYSREVPNDDVCVLFIKHEGDEKTRRIFNKVNRYAKPTSKGDNLITSEDDGYAILTRWLQRPEAPLAKAGSQDIVRWQSNTLPARRPEFTTMSAVYETVKLILADHGVRWDEQERPRDDELEASYEVVEGFWQTVLQGLEPYQEAFTDTARIPKMREDSEPTSLLFKPAAQLALFKGLILAKAGGRLSLAEAVERANNVDWCMKSAIWRDVLVRASGAIDASAAAREPSAQLIAYLIAADKMDEDEVTGIQDEIDRVVGHHKPLPDPVVQLV